MNKDFWRDKKVFITDQDLAIILFNDLHAKIGKLALENEFLESTLTKAGPLSAKR